jgi:hypothetical protein
MSTYKSVNDNYTITCADGFGIFTVNAANIRFNGNVTQSGSNTVVYDFITVAANNTGAVRQMGMLGQTGPSTFAGLQFNSETNTWQISPNVTSLGYPITPYVDIAATPGGNTASIQFNQHGSFGGSDNLLFDWGNSYIYANATQYIGYQATPPDIANAVALYSNVTGSGGTGLYFTSSSANDELVSKSKAIVFAIIF